MKYELKDYQEKAARELIENMTYLMESFVKRSKIGSCCLSAPTGAGKTVIAAAVIEALIGGNAEWNISADADACVLWMCDLPSLVLQTKGRLEDASDLDPSRIEYISDKFCQSHSTLDTGKVYFLHRQLLGKGKKLEGGGESLSFWQLMRDTISSGVHLYLFLDEAHRGLGSVSDSEMAADATIYAKVIDGEDGSSPVPVVVGISATPKRFLAAMEGRRGRTNEAPTRVDPADVQASGLLKDDIILHSPKTTTAAEHGYLIDACKALTESRIHWRAWCLENDVVPVVEPLIVVQVPDKVSPKRIGELVKDMRTYIDNLDTDAFAHVMSGYGNINTAGITIPYVSPENVEESREVRILFAKEAISTGWDCPRAEVIYSMRPHRDETYITQLIGRMLRTPLARRIEDDPSLNAVRCYLPLFDEKSVKAVKKRLTSHDQDDGNGISKDDGRNVMVNPVNVVWNHSLGVDGAFGSIRRRVESHHPDNYILAAYEFADLLARHNIDGGKAESKTIKDMLLRTLKTYVQVFSDEHVVQIKALSSYENVEERFGVFTGLGSDESGTFIKEADAYSLRHARRIAEHVFTERLANSYFKSLTAERAKEGKKADPVAVNKAVAAAARVPQIVNQVTKAAETELNRMQLTYQFEIQGLSEVARSEFNSVLSANGVHRDEYLRIPENGIQDAVNTEYVLHVLSSVENQKAWLDLDDPEQTVVKYELKRGCVAFYRNPSAGKGPHVFTVVYQHPDGGHKNMHPDFLFFELVDGHMKPVIVDPHWTVKESEAKAKLVGLTRYARAFGSDFSRIWAVNTDATRYLDILDRDTAKAIEDSVGKAATPDDLYKKWGHDYRDPSV